VAICGPRFKEAFTKEDDDEEDEEDPGNLRGNNGSTLLAPRDPSDKTLTLLLIEVWRREGSGWGFLLPTTCDAGRIQMSPWQAS
jgi:hypothetical protein